MAENATKKRKSRIWPSIVVIAAFTLSLGVFFSYLAEEYARYSEHTRLKTNVTSLAATFDPNQVASLSGSPFDEGTQSFDILRGQLKRIKTSSPHFQFVYLMGKAGDDIYFMADAEAPGTENYSAPGDIYKESSAGLHKVFQNGVGLIEGPVTDDWGTWVSAHAAIRNHNGEVIAILGIDQSAEEWMRTIEKTRYAGLLITLMLSGLSTMIFALLKQGRRNNLVLKESASNIETFLNSTPDALVIINDKGEIVQTNDEIDTVFGYKAENILHKTMKDLMVPADHERLIDLWVEYFDKGKVEANFSALEFNGVKSSGEIFPMELRLSRFTSDGKTYSCGIFRDISERKAYDQRVAGIREEADAANRAKSQYLADMSHELRTPLNAVLGYSELLQGLPDEAPGEKRAEYLDRIVSSGKHMLEIIGNVLDIAQIESGAAKVELSDMDIHSLAEQCLSMVQPLADAANVTTSLEGAGSSLPYVQGNLVQLKQVIINLLSNAVKYNETGGSVTLAIETTSHGFVRLAVSDTGSGISPEMRDKIFSPYERLNNQDGSEEGHGLGLSIAKSLVENMGGTIGYKANIEKGSVFWFELPVAIEEDKAASQ